MELKGRWRTLWSHLGAQGSADAAYLDLARRYAEPQRAYHTLAHIEHGLRELDRVRTQAREPLSVELAFWFHDAVYDPRSRENEEHSAALAGGFARNAGLQESVGQRVRELILFTKKHAAPREDGDAQILLDIDLAILGQAPASFDAYEAQVRREYDWVPEDTFRRERARMLRALLERPALYGTTALRERYEKQARANLMQSLGLLEGPRTSHPG